jgi:hypothetical protein
VRAALNPTTFGEDFFAAVFFLDREVLLAAFLALPPALFVAIAVLLELCFPAAPMRP